MTEYCKILVEKSNINASKKLSNRSRADLSLSVALALRKANNPAQQESLTFFEFSTTKRIGVNSESCLRSVDAPRLKNGDTLVGMLFGFVASV